MNQDALIEGIKFAEKHSLTHAEMRLLILFLEKPLTASQLAEKLGSNKTTIHHLIMRLKLKNLLILVERDKNGNNLYQFNVANLGN
jgi:DNA-binding MarR family transcriptional regulator